MLNLRKITNTARNRKCYFHTLKDFFFLFEPHVEQQLPQGQRKVAVVGGSIVAALTKMEAVKKPKEK